MENSNKKIASKDSSDKTIRRKRSEANATVSLPKPSTSSRNQFSAQNVTPHNTVDIGRVGRCVEILLQHDLPESLARSLVKDAADVGQLIHTIQTVNPNATSLLRALEELKNDESSKEDRLLPVPKHKLPWLQVLLKHGVPKDLAAALIQDIVGGVVELADKLREAMPEDADALLKKVFFPFCD